jgi:hypothetical protein
MYCSNNSSFSNSGKSYLSASAAWVSSVKLTAFGSPSCDDDQRALGMSLKTPRVRPRAPRMLTDKLGQRLQPDCGELAGGVPQGILGVANLGQKPVNGFKTEQLMDNEQQLVEVLALRERPAILGP